MESVRVADLDAQALQLQDSTATEEHEDEDLVTIRGPKVFFPVWGVDEAG